MCDMAGCKCPALFWVLTSLPAGAPSTEPNPVSGLVHPDRNSGACGRHLAGTVRRLHAYVADYLRGPGEGVAYGWRGLVVVAREGDSWDWQ